MVIYGDLWMIHFHPTAAQLLNIFFQHFPPWRGACNGGAAHRKLLSVIAPCLHGLGPSKIISDHLGLCKNLDINQMFFFPDVIDFFLLSSLIVFSGYWGIMEYWTNRCRIIIFSHLRSLHISTWYYNILQNHPTYTPVGCSPKRTNARVLVSTQRWRRNSVHGGGHRPCASLRDWSTAAKGPCIFWSAFDIIWCGIMWYLFCCLHIVNTDDDEDHLVPV